MKTIIALSAFVLSSCFYSGMDDDVSRIDPQLKPYFDSFIAECKARGIAVYPNCPKIVFGQLSGSGMTYHNTETIVINPSSDAWSMQPEQLVFHELGHLYLHRDHMNKVDDMNEPVSIMSEQLPFYNVNFMGPQIFRHSRAHFMDELFSR
jgi:Zn-dependent peptidase ImmA (M78 family)